MKKVILGHLSFNVEVVANDRRKFSIEILGPREIKVSAPDDVSWLDVRERILKKERWILRRSSIYQDLPLVLPERQIETGEGYYLLGQQYRITVKHGDNLVSLDGQNLIIQADDMTQPKEVFTSWLTDYVNDFLEARFVECLNNFQLKLDVTVSPRLRIKRMKNRWGSCSPNNLITLNTELIAARPECIDYVILHELCHTIHLDHSDDFYKTLKILRPKYTEDKHTLETTTQLVQQET